MRRSEAIVVLVACAALVACGKGASPPAPGSAAPPAPAPAAQGSAAWTCDPQPFEASTPLPEASGAALLDGKLVSVGDSGQHGAYAIIDPDSGKTLEQGKLPLGDPPDASDDLEGLSILDGKLVAISSAGWIRVYTRTEHGFSLAQGPYALGPIDLPVKGGLGDKPPKGDGMVCPVQGTNCGRNYEGICLGSSGSCAGYALSKADGHLYCLTLEQGQLVVHRDGAIKVGRPGTPADCAIADDGSIWVGHNVFAFNNITRVDHGVLTEIQGAGIGFSEAIAVRGNSVWRLSDSGGAPSLMAKFRCAANPR